MHFKNLVLTFAALAIPALAQQNPFATTITVTRDYAFPPVGIGTTETARVNVVNNAANTTANAASCSGSIEFVGANGTVIGAATKFTVTAGQIFSLDLPFNKAGITGNHGEIVATVTTSSTVFSKVPCSLAMSLETYDSSSGATHIVVGNPSLVSAPISTSPTPTTAK